MSKPRNVRSLVKTLQAEARENNYRRQLARAQQAKEEAVKKGWGMVETLGTVVVGTPPGKSHREVYSITK